MQVRDTEMTETGKEIETEMGTEINYKPDKVFVITSSIVVCVHLTGPLCSHSKKFTLGFSLILRGMWLEYKDCVAPVDPVR